MVLKFCANLNFMFQEASSLLERYTLAKEAGFSGIECGSIYDFPPSEIVEILEKNQLQQVLINVPTGNIKEGELGFAALPDKVHKFVSSFYKALDYAKALNCKKIHIMSGIVKKRDHLHYLTFERNLRQVIPILEKEGITGMIEPLNPFTVPGYFLDNYTDAVEIIKKFNSPNLKLQLDIYHLQLIRGNLTVSLRDLVPFAGHIQIAQVPNRHEPDIDGEIDFAYILPLLERYQYSGWVGLEYNPSKSSKDSLKWISKYGYSL